MVAFYKVAEKESSFKKDLVNHFFIKYLCMFINHLPYAGKRVIYVIIRQLAFGLYKNEIIPAPEM